MPCQFLLQRSIFARMACAMPGFLSLYERCCSAGTKMLRLSRCGKNRKCSERETMAQMCWETGERACILCPPCFSPTPFLCSFLFLFSDSSMEPELSPVQKHAKYKMCEKRYCLKTQSFPPLLHGTIHPCFLLVSNSIFMSCKLVESRWFLSGLFFPLLYQESAHISLFR